MGVPSGTQRIGVPFDAIAGLHTIQSVASEATLSPFLGPSPADSAHTPRFIPPPHVLCGGLCLGNPNFPDLGNVGELEYSIAVSDSE